jgi:hypothetical protein
LRKSGSWCTNNGIFLSNDVISKKTKNNFILVSYDYISYNSNSFFSIHTLSEIVMKYTIGDSDCVIHIYEVLKKKLSSKE